MRSLRLNPSESKYYVLYVLAVDELSHNIYRASGRSRKRIKFRMIFRDKFAEETADFVGISLADRTQHKGKTERAKESHD